LRAAIELKVEQGKMMIKVGVYGATGYTGIELVKILLGHPEAELAFLTTEPFIKGQNFSDVSPGAAELPLCSTGQADTEAVDAIFTCLPHTVSMEVIKRVYRPGLKVIDLSADFRFASPEEYKQWYGVEHLAPELLSKSAYGLPEFFREEIAACEIVANPGCYPTGVLLALGPLAEEGLPQDFEVIIDAKSGVSGAGRKASLNTHYVEVNGNLVPYKMGRAHSHVGEMELILSRLAGRELKVAFTPQLAPFSRGILETIYVRTQISAEQIRELYSRRYAHEPFIKVLDRGKPAQLAYVRYNNNCAIGVHDLDASRLVLISAAVDNLVKGAAGQAVQNFNIVFGLDETAGLSPASGRI